MPHSAAQTHLVSFQQHTELPDEMLQVCICMCVLETKRKGVCFFLLLLLLTKAATIVSSWAAVTWELEQVIRFNPSILLQPECQNVHECV